ncbi:hypothetical protein ACI2LV_11230 [Streptomyces fungicidicus]|uniref:hypothetical protein n=1 Tax=Streptomyces TaxID=1883 RepID=UPI00339A10D0
MGRKSREAPGRADATVVRLLLVPAVMTLLGARAWWTSRRLDRILPQSDAEGWGNARRQAP